MVTIQKIVKDKKNHSIKISSLTMLYVERSDKSIKMDKDLYTCRLFTRNYHYSITSIHCLL